MIVAGLGQVGLRLCMLLRECGIPVVAIDDQPDGENVGRARRLRLPVIIGRGADPYVLRRLSLDRALALAAVTADDLDNIRVALAARAEHAPADRASGRQQRHRRRDHSLDGSAQVRDVHRIGAVFIAGLALGSAAERVVVDGETAHLRDAAGGLDRCPYPVAG